MQYNPHEYQTYATQFILTHPVAAIFLQMGLGKSVITLTAIRQLLLSGAVRKVLVIAPLRVACESAIKHAERMQYGSSAESIRELSEGKKNYLKLWFL